MSESKVNPLLASLRIPGAVTKLPSGGLFYTNGELDESVKHGEVTIYPLTAFDELNLRNVDQLINGTAIINVFAHCIPDIKKPQELFAKDVDYLLMALRKVTYGDQLSIVYTHNCKDAKEHEYQTTMSQFMQTTKSIDPTSIASLYQLTLDNGQRVHLIPIKFLDVIHIMQKASGLLDAETETLQRRLFDSVVSVIYSVDGISDRDLIEEWTKQIPAPYFKVIAKAVDGISDWGPTMRIDTVKCKDCKKLIEGGIEIPLSPTSLFM
jgi:hypothetical protein